MPVSTAQLLRHTLAQLDVLMSQLTLLVDDGDNSAENEPSVKPTAATSSLDEPEIGGGSGQEQLPATPDDATDSPTYWAYHAKRAVTPFVFEHCFFNANPAWGDLTFVTRIRKQLGCPSAIAAALLYDALLTYQTTFTTLANDSADRQTAHAQALTAAQQCIELLTAV